MSVCIDCNGDTPQGNHMRCQGCASIHRSKVALKTWNEKKAKARGEGKPVRPVDPKWLVRGTPSASSMRTQIDGGGY